MGTVFLGIFNLIKDLLAVTIIAALTLHPDLAQHRNNVVSSYLGFSNGETNQTTPVVGLVGNVTSSWMIESAWDCDDKFLGLLLTVGSSLLTISLLYGAITGRPRYILPFFWLQMFDFCITSLTVIGYFSYGPDIKRWLSLQSSFPFRDELLTLGREWLLVIAALLAVIVLWTKAYCISVVWSCYKFLIYRLTAAAAVQLSIEAPLGATATANEVAALNCSLNEAQMILPPKYEDLTPILNAPDCMGAAAPPPAYETLMQQDGADAALHGRK